MRRLTFAISILFSSAALAMPTGNPTTPIRVVTADPAVCSVGQVVLRSDLSPACAMIRVCSAVNTWTDVCAAGGASNSFETIDAPSGTDPVAETTTDTLTITATGSLTITGDSSTDAIAFDVTETDAAHDTCGEISDCVVGAITGAGNAATATALAANGANCSAGSFPLGVDASGAAETCTALSSSNAGTATALAADPANCSAGSVAGGVTAAGVAESCLDPIVSTEIDTSSELAGILGDETGTGNVVMSASPTLTGTITAAAATLSGKLTLTGPAGTGSTLAVTQTTKPTVAAGAALGSSPTVSIQNGSTDTAGLINITAGTSTTTGTIVTVTFNGTYAASPKAVILSAGGTACYVPRPYVSSITTTTFVITAAVAPTASAVMNLYYLVIE